MARLPKVRLRAIPVFPSSVTGDIGIAVDKTSGVFTITLDVSDFHVSNVPSDEMSTTYAISFGGVTTDNPDGTYSLVPFSGFQGSSANLTALAGVTSAADRLFYFTGSGTGSLATFTAFGRSLVDDADAATARATLGLVLGVDVQPHTDILTSISGQGTSPGYLVIVGDGTALVRTFTAATGSGLTVADGNGVTGHTEYGIDAAIVGKLAVANTWSAQQTFVAPILGTPASGIATNLTGTASGLTAGHVTTNANSTGDVTSVGNATTLAAGNAGNLNSGTLLAARMPALTGDITTSAGAVATAIGATKVTSAMLNSDVFSTAHSWAGQQTFVAPILGTPASGVATNLTGTAASLTAGHVTTNANLTGDVTSVGNATTLAAGNAGNLNSGTLLAARMPALTGDVTTSAGAVATTVTKINGVDQTTAWTTYTPTITAAAGTPTTVSATGRYKQIGKTVIAELDITITAIGTASGQLNATLPVTAAAFRYAGSVFEYASTGKSGAGFINGGVTPTFFGSRDAAAGSWWVNGYGLAVTITYEVP